MRIKKEEAEDIARNECERRGWLCREPIIVHQGIFSFTVRTNTRSRGGNASIRIRKRGCGP